MHVVHDRPKRVAFEQRIGFLRRGRHRLADRFEPTARLPQLLGQLLTRPQSGKDDPDVVGTVPRQPDQVVRPNRWSDATRKCFASQRSPSAFRSHRGSLSRAQAPRGQRTVLEHRDPAAQPIHRRSDSRGAHHPGGAKARLTASSVISAARQLRVTAATRASPLGVVIDRIMAEFRVTAAQPSRSSIAREEAMVDSSVSPGSPPTIRDEIVRYMLRNDAYLWTLRRRSTRLPILQNSATH